jgi:NTP pyrophosphatase (non-canonical NTP hydrolase)
MSQSFSDLQAKALAIRDHYNELSDADGHPRWGAQERMAGFVADVGELSKLIMVKKGLRRGPENVDGALAHELNDCLWSVMVIADELGIDLELSFTGWADQMHDRIEREKAL